MSVWYGKVDYEAISREFNNFYYSRITYITTASIIGLTAYMVQDFFLDREVFKSLLYPCILTLFIFSLCLTCARLRKGSPDLLFMMIVLSGLGLTYTGIFFYENGYRIYTQTLIMLAYIFVPARKRVIIAGALFNIIGTSVMTVLIKPELYGPFEQIHVFVLTLILAGIISYFGLSNLRSTYLIYEQQGIISFEKKRVEGLLRNILPEKIIEELKITGKTLPKTYTNVSILFADIVDFTSLARHLTPEELINTLSELFTKFDRIMDAHNCDRIKTIGDSYMAVSGLPGFKENPVLDLIKAAIEMIDFLEDRKTGSDRDINIRIGIHTGSVIGGVVGVKKYVFDIFGNDVNIASRMESYGETMAINCSEKSYEYAKKFYSFKKRDMINVKGVGNERMFLLDSDVRTN